MEIGVDAWDGGLRVRLIDPKDWGRGDYLFDAAKMGHYLRVTSRVEDRHGDRYELAVAVNLLGIVGPRSERAAHGGPATDSTLGLIAFAEGLRGLVG